MQIKSVFAPECSRFRRPEKQEYTAVHDWFEGHEKTRLTSRAGMKSDIIDKHKIV